MGAIDWITQNYPNGIPKNALVNLNKELDTKISEYGSIYTKEILSLSEYLDRLYLVSRNYSMYVYGCIIIAFRKYFPIETSEIIKLDINDIYYFKGRKTPEWLLKILKYHIEKNCQQENPLLFVTTKNGKRFINEKDIFMLNRSMSVSYMEPWKYAEISHLWGRKVGMIHKSYLPPSMNKANYLGNLGKIAFVHLPYREPCLVVDFLEDSFLIYMENGNWLIVSIHAISSFGNAKNYHKTKLLDFVDDNNNIRKEWYEKHYSDSKRRELGNILKF